MTKVTLPRLNQTGTNEWSDVESNDVALREVLNGEIDNENIKAGANIARSKLEGGAQGIAGTWYTPTIVATEQTRENVAFGTLTTPDEITGVVVPANGKLVINFRAKVKNSVESAGRIAIFLNGNQLQLSGGGNCESALISTLFNTVSTNVGTLASANENFADVTTGQVIGQAPLEVFAAAGTYTVSVRYKSSSGLLTAKERKLWVEVHGF